jgi:hypothetical protein
MEKNMPSSDHPTSNVCRQRAARDFSRDGFVVLRGFLGEQETATARTLVESILRLPHELACMRPNNTLLPLRWNDPLVQLSFCPNAG